ncbi:MAG: hypothetical protein ACTSR8_18020 [Promethearchaeota archaeon]
MRDRFNIYLKGIRYTIDDILNGKAGGILIAMGDSISLLIKLGEKDLNKLTEGTHIFKIEAKSIPNLEIPFELNKNNMNQKFDPLTF